jgi:ribosomal-protein-alanine N-acetyltransferase
MLLQIRTSRLEMTAATCILAEAELMNRGLFSRLLGAAIPQQWPPEPLTDALPYHLELVRQKPEWTGWLGWYAVLAKGQDRPLVGSIGFKGPAGPAGIVEVGYSVLPAYQGIGIATEMLNGISCWALAQSSVLKVEAETTPANQSSRRVLAKAGFKPIGPGFEPGTLRFRREAVVNSITSPSAL